MNHVSWNDFKAFRRWLERRQMLCHTLFRVFLGPSFFSIIEFGKRTYFTRTQAVWCFSGTPPAVLYSSCIILSTSRHRVFTQSLLCLNMKTRYPMLLAHSSCILFIMKQIIRFENILNYFYRDADRKWGVKTLEACQFWI